MKHKLKYVSWTCPICKRRKDVPEFIINETKINPCDNYSEHYNIKQKQIYDAIPQEKRQKFLDNFHKGMTVGDSYKDAGLTQDEGFAVLRFNLAQYTYLLKEAK